MLKRDGRWHVVASVSGALIGVVTLLIFATRPDTTLFSWAAWVPTILALIISELALNLVVLWRRTRNPFDWIPPLEKSSGLSQKITDARYSLCAISSKDPALWRSPTFMSYLMDNATKTLSELSAIYEVPLILSKEMQEKENYVRDCRQLMETIAKGKDPEGFVGIRLMIYDTEVLKAEEKLVSHMVSLHAKGGMYCIPIRRDILIENLTGEDPRLITDFLSSVGVQSKQQLRERKRATVPDILLIDNHSQVKPAGDNVWWFERGAWQTAKYASDYNDARMIFARLCDAAIQGNAISTDFTPEVIEAVAIPSRIALVRKFFSMPYFQQWLQRSPDLFQDWFRKEEEFLQDFAKGRQAYHILDVGCGEGRHAALLAQEGISISGVDNNATMIEKATANIKYDQMISDRVDLYLEDARKMHFQNETFDDVICMTNTFGNMPGIEQQVLNEIARVLKPNGKLVLSVYCSELSYVELRSATYRNIGLRIKYSNHNYIETQEGLYSRHFSKDDLEALCRSTGLVPDVQTFTPLAYLCEATKVPNSEPTSSG